MFLSSKIYVDERFSRTRQDQSFEGLRSSKDIDQTISYCLRLSVTFLGCMCREVGMGMGIWSRKAAFICFGGLWWWQFQVPLRPVKEILIRHYSNTWTQFVVCFFLQFSAMKSHIWSKTCSKTTTRTSARWCILKTRWRFRSNWPSLTSSLWWDKLTIIPH